MEKQKITVVIVSYQRNDILQTTIAHILKQKADFHELLVVDQDGRLEHIQGVRYYAPKHKGLSYARNYGIRKANGDIILFLDDDIIPKNNLIQNHRNAYKNSAVIGVAGRVVEKNTIPNDKPVGKISRFGARYESNFANTRPQPVDFVKGANMSFKKSALLAVNGFDETLKTAFDEIDLCLRMRKKLNGLLIFEPSACIEHLQHKGGGTRSIHPVDYKKNYYHDFGHMFRNNFPLFYLPFFLMFQCIFFLRDYGVSSCTNFFSGYKN